MEIADASSGHHVTHRDHIDEGGLARVLEPHQGQLHLLLPEERLEPVQQLVDERYHLRRLVLTASG